MSNNSIKCSNCGTTILEAGWQHPVCPRCFLETAAEKQAGATGLDATMPSHIGAYKIQELIGEGGMGLVYRAEQIDPVSRIVAIKVIKRGMDTQEVIARFEAERQALAMMDHPSIARVIEAGETEEGRPYFVMEYVQGMPVTEHCDRHRFSIKERLELFSRVCQGVQHAHQKGVIHRDLKPSNVLVRVQDGEAVPKIIDFGIAKATAMKLTETTLYTAMGVMIGTPEYMSPEQVAMKGGDVDTRSDVYSLGVLLFELLTGVLPFEPGDLRKAGFDEIRRVIREQEPPKPSTRVSSLGDDSEELAGNRQTEPGKLVGDLRGDLDWIVMKALEKDCERRYDSPLALVEDIRRHLSHEPVAAGPPSATYRVRKFVRRNRIGVAAAAVMLLSMIGGAIGVTAGLQRALEAESEARAEAERADEVIDLLVGMFDLADPGKTSGEPMTARELLQESARRVEAEITERPLLRARLQHELGRVHASLGDFDDSRRLTEMALKIRSEELGATHPDTLATMARAASIEERQGNLEASERLYLEALESARSTLAEGDPLLIRLLRGLCITYKEWKRLDEAEEYCSEAHSLAVRHLDSEDDLRLGAMNELSGVWGRQGRHEESLAIKKEILKVRIRLSGEDNRSTLILRGNIGHDLMVLDRYQESEAVLREVLEREKRVLGPDHPVTFWTTFNLGYIHMKLESYAEAEPLLRIAYENRKKVRGPRHPATLNNALNLGQTLIGLERYEEVVVLLDDTLGISRSVHGADHPATLWIAYWLGWAHEGAGDLEAAEDLYRQALEGQRKLGGGKGRDTARRLAALYDSMGRVENGQALRSEFDIEK